jgi:hypothetical protein
MNRKQIKMYKNILAIMSYLLFVLLFGKSLDSINPNNLEFIDIINIIGTTAFSVIFVKSILSPYLVINSNEVIIRRDYFKNVSIKKDTIEDYIEGNTPFSSSYFLTKDNEKIKFNSAAIKSKDRELLLQEFSKERVNRTTEKNGS